MEGQIFNRIARDYHQKRKKPWRPLEFFVNYLKKKGYVFNGIILDLGAANGRNFKILGTLPKKIIGIDISLELLKIAHNDLQNREHYSKEESSVIQIVQGDIKYLPIRDNTVQNIFSIATIHHIKHKTERKKMIASLNKTLRPNGSLVITVWRKWQKKYRSYFLYDWLKRFLSSGHKYEQEMVGLTEFGDKLIPWTLSDQRKAYHRFYHFFSKHELKKLLKIFHIKEFKIMGGPSKRDNFFIFAQKVSD
ncbi:MAG: class I SAM-dependent methyltransferase [Promethearchaeota archaeon]|jgi:SAM-dependent methyltransferase